jgi:hypothetical protein
MSWGWNPDSVTAISTAALTGGVIFAGLAAVVAVLQAKGQTRATRAAIIFQIKEKYSSREMLTAIEYLLDRKHPSRRDPFQYLDKVFGDGDMELHHARRLLSQFLNYVASLVSEEIESEDFADAALGGALDHFEILAPIEYRLSLRTHRIVRWPLMDLYILRRSKQDARLRQYRPASGLKPWQVLLRMRNARWDREDAGDRVLRRHRRFVEALVAEPNYAWAALLLRAIDEPLTPAERETLVDP